MAGAVDNLRAIRVQEIENLVRRFGAVSISDLAKQFDKTPVTIRRDLLMLEYRGLVKRTYGGAIAAETTAYKVNPYHLREAEQAAEKTAIARKAAEFIKDGDSLILNAGTTMQALARELRRRKNLQVVTNGATVVVELAEVEGAEVVLIGGEVDLKKLGTIGPIAEEYLENLHVAKAFLTVAGVSASRGISMHTHGHARLNKRFIASADEVTVLVDSAKFESHSLFPIAPIGQVRRVVTDANAPPKVCDAIRKKGIEVVLAD